MMNTPEPFEPTYAANAHEFTAHESLPKRESAAPHASDALEESEVSYRYLFETNPNPMWIYDFETFRFLLVNEAAVRHYGYSQDEFLAILARRAKEQHRTKTLQA